VVMGSPESEPSETPEEEPASSSSSSSSYSESIPLESSGNSESSDSQEDSLANRKEQAEKIASNPVAYKICMGCGSILAARVNICPNCHSYRYDSDRDSIIKHAHELGQRRSRSVLSSDMS